MNHHKLQFGIAVANNGHHCLRCCASRWSTTRPMVMGRYLATTSTGTTLRNHQRVTTADTRDILQYPHRSLNDELNSAHIDPIDVNIEHNDGREHGTASSTIENFEMGAISGEEAVEMEDSGSHVRSSTAGMTALMTGTTGVTGRTREVTMTNDSTKSHGLYVTDDEHDNKLSQQHHRYFDPTTMREVKESPVQSHYSVQPSVYPTDTQTRSRIDPIDTKTSDS